MVTPPPVTPRPVVPTRPASGGAAGGREGSTASITGTRRERRRTSLFAHGEPMVWVAGGSLCLALLMIAGLIVLVMSQGFASFWPGAITRAVLDDGTVVMGEITRVESVADAGAAEDPPQRRLLRTGNFEITQEHFRWVDDSEIASIETPEDAVLLERLAWGRFYGLPVAFEIDGGIVAEGPEAAWASFQQHHGEVRDRWDEARHLEHGEIGAVNAAIERRRLATRQVGLDSGFGSPEYAAAQGSFAKLDAEQQLIYDEIQGRVMALDAENDRYRLVLATATGHRTPIEVASVVRAVQPNALGTLGRAGVYVARWYEYLTGEPREANSEGGVFPAIFGTVLMTMIMTLFVVPFGVLAALYLREYAKQGVLVSAVRIAVNNLAGVPSIVFGVFGLGFFCSIIGASLDQVLFESSLPSPTFGTGGILWASLTLALLTLPVVIVATEEALAAVPNSMREGSYACGASKWQTIKRIVLPKAAPGIMTGVVLAIARGAGEVAPLMLVGAVKLAPELPFDTTAPFFHLERSFMHLGFHIYDLGFQSQNSEAAKPMVFTTTLLLIGIVVMLNIGAITIRTRLNKRFGNARI